MSKKHKKHHRSDKDTEDKPGLKLVLKVGTPDQGDNTPPPPPEEHEAEKKHKHKKKKKKHKHHKDEPEGSSKEKPEKRKSEKLPEPDISEVDEEVIEPALKKQATETNVATPAPISARSLRERKSVEDDQGPLQRCLSFIHKTLERKDHNGFFAYPVTDNIAPSYSKIISCPMDMSTISEKIEANDYRTLPDYKADFKLMCDNCMKYNHPETIYFKEAEKMLKAGLKLMSKEKMVFLKRTLPVVAVVHDRELGIDQELAPDGTPVVPSPKPNTPRQKKHHMTKFEAFPDRLTPEQILAQAQDAAKDAADQLTLRKPNTKFGFLRRRDDGSTTLSLLNPENDGIVSEKERVVNLGSLLGKLPSGTGTLAGFKEDKRNKALPVNYLNYGPFSSYAPIYDSSQANLSKDDSDLLLNAYGDEAGIQYAYSICHFVKDAGEYAVRMVDNLLDIITGGDHSKARTVTNKVEEAEKDDTPEEVQVKTEPEDEQCVADLVPKLEPMEDIDFDSLRSLADLGIDTGFVDKMEDTMKQEQELQKKLDDTSELLKDLQQTQYERLSQNVPQHLAHTKGPDEREQELAEKVTRGLTDLVKQAHPSLFSSTQNVRDALGVSLGPEDPLIQAADELTVAAADTTTADVEMSSDGAVSDMVTDVAMQADPVTQNEVLESMDISQIKMEAEGTVFSDVSMDSPKPE